MNSFQCAVSKVAGHIKSLIDQYGFNCLTTEQTKQLTEDMENPGLGFACTMNFGLGDNKAGVYIDAVIVGIEATGQTRTVTYGFNVTITWSATYHMFPYSAHRLQLINAVHSLAANIHQFIVSLGPVHATFEQGKPVTIN